MTLLSTRVLGALGMMAVSAVALLWAGERVNPVNAGRAGAAIHGFDPVAYFDDSAAVKRSKGFSSLWQGATWRFASAENKAKFERDPARYAPQYGAIAHGR